MLHPARLLRTLPLHVLGALWLCGAWRAALGLFVLTWLLLAVRDALPARLRPTWAWLGLGALSGTLVLLRDPWLLPGRWAGLFEGLRFLGLGYAFLRASYVLFDPRPWPLASLARYYWFLPAFVSGPVLSPGDVLEPPPVDREALPRAAWGALKLTLAAALAPVVPLADACNLELFLPAAVSSPAWGWAGAAASGAWLYLQFSAWSDLSVAAAWACGARARENFDRPWAAADPASFWRRWHVSLGDWLRALVYDPLARLGAARGPATRLGLAVLAPLVTMLACGAWHGLGWGFLAWGAWHGTWLGGHAAWSALPLSRAARRWRAWPVAAWVLPQAAVVASWTLFLPVDPRVGLADRLALLRGLVGWT